MKSILKYLGLAGLAAGIFAACEHPDISEIFDGDAMSQEGNIAYMYTPAKTNYTWQYRASSAEGGYSITPEVAEEVVLTNVELARPAEKAVTVTLEYDTEALEELNARLIKEEGEGARQYKLFEKSKINALTFDFAVGEDKKPLILKLDGEEIFANDESHYFALPLRIASTTDDGGLISTNAGGFMLTFDISYAANQVRFASSSSNYALQVFENGEPRNDLQEAQLTWMNASFAAAENSTVKLRINNDLIASSAYPNDQPVPGAKLENDTFVLEAGQTQTDFVKLLFPNGLKGLKSGTNYQVPIEVESVSGRGMELVTSTVFTYRITTSTFVPNYVTFTKPEYTFTAKFAEGKLTNGTNRVTTDVNIKAAKAASGYTYVYIKIDNSLIDAYNQQNGTHYEAVSNASLYYDYVYLYSGYTAGSSSYNISIRFNDSMASLQSGHEYLIPITFDEARFSGGDPNIAAGLTDNVVYFKIASTEVEASYIQAASGPVGTEIPRDQFDAYTISSDEPDNLKTNHQANIRGNGTGSFYNIGDGIWIDLGQTYSLKGMSFTGSSMILTYAPKIIGMEVSTDGTSWKDLGTSDPLNSTSPNYASLKTATEARYVRLWMIQNQAGYQGAYLSPQRGIIFYQ